jgi:hypothetical protein
MDPQLCNRTRIQCYRFLGSTSWELIVMYCQDYLEAATRHPDEWSLDEPVGATVLDHRPLQVQNGSVVLT